jgi:hypothetical protein
MRKRFIAAAVCGALATACSDAPDTGTPVGPPSFQAVAAACPSPDSVRALIRVLFPRGVDRNAALARFNSVVRAVNKSPVPDTAGARSHALSLIEFTLKKFEAGQLTSDPGPPTPEARVAATVNGILCLVGLPQTMDEGALGDDGAVAIVTPASDTSIVTETGWAGVDIDPGDVPTTTLITVTRLPDGANPLLTPFDQYPMFFEFHASPAPTFDNPVVVGVCLPDGVNPPDLSRLRLAHNVAPFTYGAIEVLPLESASFLDCSDASLSAAPGPRGVLDVASSGGRLLLAAARGLFVPRPLQAATMMFGTGIGGSVRTFSPFGLVDTLGIVHAVSPVNQNGTAGQPVTSAPTVALRTPTGAVMGQVPVAFTVTQGGGTAVTPLAITDVNGRAGSAWILGSPGPQALTAVPQTPAGTGFVGSPKLFRAQAY